MKTRETFEAIRNQENKLSLRVRLTLVVSVELVFCILIALGLTLLLERFIHFDSKGAADRPGGSSAYWWGIPCDDFLSRWFRGHQEAGRRMESVADGDFPSGWRQKSSARRSKRSIPASI